MASHLLLAHSRGGSAPSGPSLAPKLHIEGPTFRTETGAIWPWRMATDFMLFRRWLNGDDLGAVIAQRKTAGANGVRVNLSIAFGTPETTLLPDQFTDVQLADFCHWLGELGLTAELVLMGGGDTLVPASQQQAFVDRIADVVRACPWVCLEIFNEGTHPTWPATIASSIRLPAGVLVSRGSGIGDGHPLMPFGTHSTFHPGRGDEWPRKVKSAGEYTNPGKFNIPPADVIWQPGKPCVSNETNRAADLAPDPDDWYACGATASLLSAGACGHTENGKYSRLWTPAEEACMYAFFQGMRDVPTICQTWTYAKAIPQGEGLSDPGALRVFGMVQGNEQWAVVLRPTQSAQPINGWRIGQTYGRLENVVRLER